MRLRCLGGVIAVLDLAGCGGGGSSADDAVSVAQMNAQISSQSISDPAQLPVSGRAQYDGYMRTALPTGPEGARVEYLGDMTLAVNFGAGFDQIRGHASGFEARDATPLSGGLAITNGNIYRDTKTAAAYSFDGDVDGALSNGSARYTIDASIEGEFLAPGQTAVRGLWFGDVTGPLGQDIFDGTFAATRRAE